MEPKQHLEFKKGGVRAKLLKTEDGDIMFTVDTRDGLGGAIVVSNHMLGRFLEILGWAKGHVDKL